MPVQDSTKCTGVGFGINPDRQVCAGGEFGKSSCRGDSGGGLFIHEPTEGPWYVFGIVSFGGFDCEAEIPEVYTRCIDSNFHLRILMINTTLLAFRVSSYVEWIIAEMKKRQ